MYISRVYLDVKKYKTAQAVYNRGILHGALEQCFQGKRQRTVWRLERMGGKIFIMMVSKEEPDYTSFCDQFGVDGIKAEIKQYDTFVATIRDGETLRFRLTANPTIKKDKKRIPLNKEKTNNQPYSALDWVIDRIKKNGAEIMEVQIIGYESHTIIYNGKKITLVEAVYDGSLRVTDQSLFSEALINGIGHGKAYGCGMITVMR